jgi:UDP-2,3-diacylglucosamine hydrolase
MDVNAQTDTVRAQGVTRLIRGHTHCQAIHDFTLDEAPAQRIALGDWDDTICVLPHDDEGYWTEIFVGTEPQLAGYTY